LPQEETEINSFFWTELKKCPPDRTGTVGISTVWMVWGLNASGGNISHTCPDWLWVSSSLLYNGTGTLSLTQSSALVKEREEL